MKKTVLNPLHHEMGGRMVEFGGWEMPLHYGSQLEEHHQVRRDAGMFDVSHMTVIDLQGERAKPFLRMLLANDVDKLKQRGKALYSCMLNEDGGVIDDLIVYYLDDRHYRLVVNAGTTDKDLAWIGRHAAAYQVEPYPRHDLAMIAVQGPLARGKTLPLLPEALRDAAAGLQPFQAAWTSDWFVARTGYTGEDGFEVMLPETEAAGLWRGLHAAGVAPIGLGARDTLRLEAGMNLYGSDMDESTSPLESGLAWTVAMEPAERGFIGRPALERQLAAGVTRKQVGLLLTGRGVLRNHQKLHVGEREIGEITSGGFAPTLQQSIALARVEADAPDELSVAIRDKRIPAKVVRPPFARNGKALVGA